MINEPDLLLWDEPTAGLDPTGRKYALDLIQGLKSQGKTMIISTHVLPDADHVCDYIGVLNQGKLVFCGSVMEMKQFVRENRGGPGAGRGRETVPGVIVCRQPGPPLGATEPGRN